MMDKITSSFWLSYSTSSYMPEIIYGNILPYDHFTPRFTTKKAPLVPNFDQDIHGIAFKSQSTCHCTIPS